MPKSRRRAGQNIRNLAFKRRMKAIMAFIAAGLVIILPVALIRAFSNFMEQLSSTNGSESQISINLPPIFYVMLVVVALGLVASGVLLWQKADRADQGAKGEESTGQALVHLERMGWQIEYGLRLGKGLGDIDIVCISPQNKAFVIDVKSHRGTVKTDGKKLYRQMGSNQYPFEKDFLSQVMKQALQVKSQKGLNFVTPIVAFSDARVAMSSGKVRGVYVVEKARLDPLLKSLG